MKAELKGLELVDSAFASFQPSDAEHFCVAVEARIGPLGGKGEDVFSFLVCSPSWLSENYKSPMFCRHLIVMNVYSHCTIRELVGRVVSEVERPTWVDLARYFGRYFRWEFEDIYGQDGDGYAPTFPYRLRLPVSDTS